MKMSEEEIKKYTEAISKNSDNLFVCPRPVKPWQAPKGGLGHNSPTTLHGTTVQPLQVTGVLCSIFQSWDARSFYTAYNILTTTLISTLYSHPTLWNTHIRKYNIVPTYHYCTNSHPH